MSRSHWSDDEKRIIEQIYADPTIANPIVECTRWLPNRSPHSIQMRASYKGLTKKRKALRMAFLRRPSTEQVQAAHENVHRAIGFANEWIERAIAYAAIAGIDVASLIAVPLATTGTPDATEVSVAGETTCVEVAAVGMPTAPAAQSGREIEESVETCHRAEPAAIVSARPLRAGPCDLGDREHIRRRLGFVIDEISCSLRLSRDGVVDAVGEIAADNFRPRKGREAVVERLVAAIERLACELNRSHTAIAETVRDVVASGLSRRRNSGYKLDDVAARSNGRTTKFLAGGRSVSQSAAALASLFGTNVR